MAKSHTFNSFTYTFALIVRNADGQRINGTVSTGDQAGAITSARSILRQLAAAASVDVYLYGVNLEISDPVESVYREAAERNG